MHKQILSQVIAIKKTADGQLYSNKQNDESTYYTQRGLVHYATEPSLSPSAIAELRTGSGEDLSIRIFMRNLQREKRLTEICVSLSFPCCQSLLVVVSQELVKEIDSFIRDVSLVLRGNEPCPRFPRIPAALLGTIEGQHANRMH